MKTLLALVPALALIVVGCDLTGKPAAKPPSDYAGDQPSAPEKMPNVPRHKNNTMATATENGNNAVSGTKLSGK